MGIISMLIMKIGDVVIDNAVDESIFNVIMDVGDPCFHFFGELVKFGINDGAVGSLDVLAT